MQLHNVSGGPQDQTLRPGRDDQTLLECSVFNKEKDRQMVKFNEKPTRRQPITAVVSR
jgi:hypothetical protein